MKKKIILGLMCSLTLTSTCFFGNSLKALNSQNVKSPSLECLVNKNLVDKENKRAKLIDAKILQKDNSLNISIKNSSDDPNEKEFNVASDEKMFVVIKDRLGLKPTQKFFLDEIDAGYFQKSVEMPYFYDMIYLDFYKQKKSDPDFTEKEENFIGKTKICMRNVTAFYLPNQKFEINDVKASKDSEIYIRALPNFYRVDIKNSSSNRITKIVLPQGEDGLMSDEDRVNAVEDVRIIYSDRADSNAHYVSLYIPKNVTEFNLLIYEKEITEYEVDVISQYNIKLNRI